MREARPASLSGDANAGWSADEAFEAAVALTGPSRGGGPLDYMEQPCATVEELAELRRRLGARGMLVRVAADELIRKASDPLAVVQARACDVAVLKAAPLGGVSAVRRIAEEVGRYGVAVTVSSALESAVGMYAGLLATASLPQYADDEYLVAAPQAAGQRPARCTRRMSAGPARSWTVTWRWSSGAAATGWTRYVPAARKDQLDRLAASTRCLRADSRVRGHHRPHKGD